MMENIISGHQAMNEGNNKLNNCVSDFFKELERLLTSSSIPIRIINEPIEKALHSNYFGALDKQPEHLDDNDAESLKICQFSPPTAKIYCWMSRVLKGEAGHLSLLLSDGTTYISHWPGNNSMRIVALLLKEASQKQTFECDRIAKGRDPDEILEIPDGTIDEEKLKHWWWDYVKWSKYNLFIKNCAQTVQLALRKGGIKEPMNLSINITPYGILCWARKCVEWHEPFRNCEITQFVTNSYLDDAWNHPKF